MTHPTAPVSTSPTADDRTGVASQKWIRGLLATDRSTTALVLRLTLAVVIFPHGAQKLLGWFGGPGFSGTTAYFAELGIVIAILIAGSGRFSVDRWLLHRRAVRA